MQLNGPQVLVKFIVLLHKNFLWLFKFILSGEGVSIFEGNRMSGGEEVYSLLRSSFFVFELRENRQKNGCI